MDRSTDLPVKVNITKSVVFVSALLFTLGIYLIATTFSEWLYFSDYYSYIRLFKHASYGSIIILILFVVLPFIFPSNDFLNISALLKKRFVRSTDKLLFSLGKIETSIIIFLILFLIGSYLNDVIVPLVLFLIFIFSLFIQTPYQKEQTKKTGLSRYKIEYLNYIDKYISTRKYLSVLTGGFFQQLFPSSENIFIYIIALMMPNLFAGIFTILFIQLFHNLFLYWQVFDLSKRGGYFRHYVNVMTGLILAYYSYQVFF